MSRVIHLATSVMLERHTFFVCVTEVFAKGGWNASVKAYRTLVTNILRRRLRSHGNAAFIPKLLIIGRFQSIVRCITSMPNRWLLLLRPDPSRF
jgi:hypothetical protein